MAEQDEVVVLNGSYGAGVNALLTIIKSQGDGKIQEQTFQVPYALVDQGILKKLTDSNFIRGFRIEKQETVEQS